MTPPVQRAAPLLLLAAFVCAVLTPFVLLGKAFYWGDLSLYFYPMQAFVRDSLLQGRLPLWNPHVLCGQPLVGNPQSWVFYPGTALLLALPITAFFTVNAVVHLLGAAWGTYLYLRRICHDRLGAMTGACVYAGSGYVIARLQFPNMAQSMAYLPWLMLLVDRIIAKPEIGYAGLAALTVALCVLAAHAQIAYLTLLCASIYALARIYLQRRHGRRIWRALGWLGAALAVGIAASAAQALPALQLFTESTREHLRFFEATRFTLNPEELLNFVAPGYFGHPGNGDYWGPGNLWETSVYVGIIPLLLTTVAVIKKSTRPAVAFFSVVGLASLLLAMGQWGGLFWAAFYVIPGISSFHDPARFAFLTTFALAALSAIGMRLLRERGIRDGARCAAAALTALNLWWFSAAINPGVEASALAAAPRLDLQGARVYSYATRDLWEHFVNYADYGPRSSSYISLLASSMAPNSMMRLRIPEASGYEPVPTRNMTEVDRVLRQALYQKDDRLGPLLAAVSAGIIAVPADTRMAGSGLVPGPGWRSWRPMQPGPSMWMVKRSSAARDSAESLGSLSSPELDPRERAVVEGSMASSGLSYAGGTVEIEADSLRARVRAAAGGGLLVRSAAFYPGWEAGIDGRPVKVLRVDHGLQGVAVPEGDHTVSFRYRPQVFQVGLYVSCLSVALMSLALTAGGVLRGRRRARR